ncbi:ingression protein fic1, partial [Favolaschia claudopus]
MSSPSPGREIGTLIVVILKANHLPNKRNIGKQDPYCLVSLNGEKQRTKVIKRGGQHPEWDEEIRFRIYEEEPITATGPDGAPPPPPPKDGKRRIKGGAIMKLSCFADDPREPSLIGQTDVDLTEVLTLGETDEWFTLMNKDKFAGKVYLELTFWSNEAPPEKKVTPTVPPEYGGTGSFISSNGPPHADFQTGQANGAYAHPRRGSDTGQSTLRASNSLAQLDLYRPAYEQQEPQNRGRVASFSTLANDFGELNVGESSRRQSLGPPIPSGFVHNRRPSSGSYQRATYPLPHGAYDPLSDAASVYTYDRPLTPPGHAHDPSAFVNSAPYAPQPPYQPPPTASSGFMPINNSNPSTFAPLPSHPSEPSGFVSHTPAPPSNYVPSHIPPSNSYPPISETPAPGYPAPLPPSSSSGFPPQPGFPSSQAHYSQFQPPPQHYPPPHQQQMQTPEPPTQQGYPLPPSPSNPGP